MYLRYQNWFCLDHLHNPIWLLTLCQKTLGWSHLILSFCLCCSNNQQILLTSSGFVSVWVHRQHPPEHQVLWKREVRNQLEQHKYIGHTYILPYCSSKKRTIGFIMPHKTLTNIVFHITDVECGCRHSHPQPIFLLDENWLIEFILLKVVQRHLTSRQLDHHIFWTVVENKPSACHLHNFSKTSYWNLQFACLVEKFSAWAKLIMERHLLDTRGTEGLGHSQEHWAGMIFTRVSVHRCTIPGECPAAQLFYEHLTAILNRSDVSTLPRVMLIPALFLFHC